VICINTGQPIRCEYIQYLTILVIPVAAQTNAWVCGGSLAEIVSSSLLGAWMSVSSECCVLSSRGLCVGPITCPEEPYGSVVCLSVIMKAR
jgi:hypothetical protein